MTKTAAVILAAGMGTRMKSKLPKVLHPLYGKPMLGYLLEKVKALGLDRIVIVIGHGREQVKTYLGMKVETVLQKEPLGTGHAVAQTRGKLEGSCENIMVLYGDTPLLTLTTLRRLATKHLRSLDVCTLLTAKPEDALPAYGRIIRFPNGKIKGIVEEVEASASQKKIREINVGAYCFQTEKLFWALSRIKRSRRKHEYYLTDCIGLLAKAGWPIDSVITEDHDEFVGINTPEQLARAEKIMRRREKFRRRIDKKKKDT